MPAPRIERNSITNSALISESAVNELFDAGEHDYGLGFYVRKNKQGRLIQFHSGRVRGFVGYMARFPESNSFIAVLCNRDDIDVLQMGRDIESLLFGETPQRSRPPSPVNDWRRRALVGKYKSDKQQVFTVELDGAVTEALIEWAPPNGPATHATLGIDEDGELVLYEPVGSTPLELQMSNELAGTVEAIELGKLVFKRMPSL